MLVYIVGAVNFAAGHQDNKLQFSNMPIYSSLRGLLLNAGHVQLKDTQYLQFGQ